jgi:putative heme-binding domain-containing protein
LLNLLNLITRLPDHPITRLIASSIVAICSVAALAAQGRSYLPGEVEGGGRLFQANCTGCHGPEGDGVPGVNFSKGQFRRATSDDDLVRVIVRGIPGTPMPPSNFSEGQAGTIVAYIRSMSAPSGTSMSGDAGRGKTLFDGKGQCLTCHSVSGSGSRTGPTLTEIGLFRPSAELQRSLVEPDAEIRPDNRAVRITTAEGATITARLLNQDTFTLQVIDPKEQLQLLDKSRLRDFAVLKTSTMPSYRDKLTAQELADVVSYLASLRGRP